MTRDIDDDSEDNRTLTTAEHRYDPSIFSPSPSFGRGGDLEDTDYDDDKVLGFGSDSGVARPASTRPLPRKGVAHKVQSKRPARNDNDRGDQNPIPCYQCVVMRTMESVLRGSRLLRLGAGSKITLNKKKTRIAMSVMMALEEENMDCVDLDPLPSPTYRPSRQLARSFVPPPSLTRKRKASPPKPPVAKRTKTTPSGCGSQSQVTKETKRTKSTKDSKKSKDGDKNVSSKVVDLDSSIDNSDDNDDVEDLEDRLLIMQLEFELKKKKRARALAARRR
ncbi:uncharacterized protein Bfra_006316 [Botrytis fragariae]|uniref:Uncharacterized protein n=1 Tax=Botrytis fragariae TaxID=1964551 RepID=A0A8H6B475_9HELO|nr:uncharacterized protein Bfra_006316 [Botrytis fragariae]KAF5879111.1 hypothetical protein Bfra_006316 [Botrytis fragariae]